MREMLDIFAGRQGTDKLTTHAYVPVYACLFAPYRESGCVMEIGVGGGGSIHAWREYFPNALILAVDNREKSLATVRGVPNVNTYCVDAYSPVFVESIKTFAPSVIIEDGSHEVGAQAWALRHYVPALAPDGVMIVEDVRYPEKLSALLRGWEYKHFIIDMRDQKNVPDDVMFVVWKKHVQ